MSEPDPPIRVTVPPGFLPERRYAVQVLLGHFLGFDVQIVPGTRGDWLLEGRGGWQLAMSDAFFGRLDPGRGYLDPGCLPAAAFDLRHELAAPVPIPVLFGTPDVQVAHGQARLGCDLFASAFFMLTRFEEVVLADRDEHGRFPAAASLAARAGFLDVPVVDAWARCLAAVLGALGSPPPRQPRFALFNTHDIDEPALYQGPRQAFLAAAHALVRRRAPAEAARTAAVALGLAADPYERFDDLMDCSERLGLRSTFYVLAEGRAPRDAAYALGDRRIGRILERIRARGHAIGLHAGYDTLHDEAELIAQKERLERRIAAPVTENRQHYLRFQAPLTWRRLEAAGLRVDSSCGFADRHGFRCGTGSAFPVFDVLERRPLRLLERPLVAMDASFGRYLSWTEEAVLEALRALTAASRRWGSGLTLLAHNSCFVYHPAFAAAYLRYMEEMRA